MANVVGTRADLVPIGDADDDRRTGFWRTAILRNALARIYDRPAVASCPSWRAVHRNSDR